MSETNLNSRKQHPPQNACDVHVHRRTNRYLTNIGLYITKETTMYKSSKRSEIEKIHEFNPFSRIYK